MPGRRPLRAARQSAADACAEALRDAILRGELPAESRLPPERALADELDVNRTTLRSALTQLTTQGLLEGRQGSGHVVRDFRRAGGLELLAELPDLEGARLVQLASDLLAIRRSLAELVFAEVARKHPPLEDVHAAVDALEASVSDGSEVVAARDLDVLAAILEATGSLALQLCFNPVMRVLAALPTLRDAMYRDPTSNVAGYRQVLALSDEPGLAMLVKETLRVRDEQTLEILRTENT